MCPHSSIIQQELHESSPSHASDTFVSLFQRIIPGALLRYLGRLRFPTLFVLTTVVLLADLAVPDALPFADEILLMLTSLLLGRLKRRKEETHQKDSSPAQGGTR